MNWLDLLSVHTVKQASQTKAENKGRGTTQSLLLYRQNPLYYDRSIAKLRSGNDWNTLYGQLHIDNRQ